MTGESPSSLEHPSWRQVDESNHRAGSRHHRGSGKAAARDDSRVDLSAGVPSPGRAGSVWSRAGRLLGHQVPERPRRYTHLSRVLDSMIPSLTTTSSRDPSRTSQSSGSQTPSSSRFGTGTTSTTCRSRWPSPSACRVAASSTASPPARILARRRLTIEGALVADGGEREGPREAHGPPGRAFRSVMVSDPSDS